MDLPEDLKYTSSHEWIRVEDGVATVGITDFAQAQLGDLTFVELPAIDDAVQTGDELAVVESVKAASDVYAPLAGTVVEVNTELESDPSLINSDSFGSGWIFKLKISNPSDLDDLMDAAQYREVAPSN